MGIDDNPEVNRAAFLKGMRQVANSVTVVTTAGEAGRAGATVSSFCSVSADPPMVLVCLRADSRIARAVQLNHRFCVNVLEESAEELAERFAGRAASVDVDRFLDVALLDHAAGLPILEASVAAFCCQVHDAQRQATHLIVIGRVSAIHVASGHRPLTYAAGQYGSVRSKMIESLY